MKHKLTRRLTALTVMFAASLAVSGSALADTFAVTNNNDAGRGSLRAAVEAANARPGGDVITFAPGVGGTINLKAALPALRGGLEVRGPGAERLTVRRSSAPGTPEFGVFSAREGSVVTVSGLTVAGGRQGRHGDGGGIHNGGTMTIRDSAVSGNKAGWGGGVYNLGELTIRNVTFSSNGSIWGGGGILNYGDLTAESSTFFVNRANRHNGGGILDHGKMTVEDSTFTRNYSATEGGGVYTTGNLTTVEGSTFSENQGGYGGGISGDGGALAISNSTFSKNTAVIDGGGINNDGSGKLTVVGGTFSGNAAGYSGGGIHHSDFAPGAAYLRLTILAGNRAQDSGPDAYGTYSSGGYNLIGSTSGSGGFGATDLRNVASGLDPEGLKNNGGPTRTIALLPESLAVDAAEAGCPPPLTDQRGVSRPQDGDGDGTALCDIGAYERRAAQ